MSDDSFHVTRTKGMHRAARQALIRLMTALPAIGPCSVSTISQSKPAAAMISADSGLSKASHEPTLTSPACNFFSYIVFTHTPVYASFDAVPVCGVVAPALAATLSLPTILSPPAPFPRIVAQSFESEFVAPGVTRGDYRLATANGPIAIEVVIPRSSRAEPAPRRRPRDRSSDLARRNDFVDGAAHARGRRDQCRLFRHRSDESTARNRDPDGTLLRTPSRRVALDVDRDGQRTLREILASPDRCISDRRRFRSLP